MRVSRAFMRDFAYIANYYQWDEATIEEVKQETRGNQELMKYWQKLAAAHRAGYKQDRFNNWQRMEEWRQSR